MSDSPSKIDGLRVMVMCLTNEPQPDYVRFEYCGSPWASAHIAIPLASLCISDDGQPPEPWDIKAMAEKGGPPALIVEFLLQVEADKAAGAVLWIDFTAPSGGLALLPWERLAAPLISAPMFRLAPNRIVQAGVREGPLAVALCASLPLAKAAFNADDLLLRGVKSVLAANPANHCHVFRDWNEGEWESFRSRLLNITSADSFTLHDPRDAEKFGLAARSRGGPESACIAGSPWLAWMKEALAGKKIELAHFFCHGYLSGSYGNLAFAQAPAFNQDESWARFVGADKLSRFLNHLDIPCLGLTSPTENYSPAGLRTLGIEVAGKRQGIVMLHDMDHDAQNEDLEEGMQLLLSARHKGRPERLHSLTIYGVPGRFAGLLGEGRTAELPDLQIEALKQTFIKVAMRKAIDWLGSVWTKQTIQSEMGPKVTVDIPKMADIFSKSLQEYISKNQAPIPAWATIAVQTLSSNLNELRISQQVVPVPGTSSSVPKESVSKDLAEWNKGREEALNFLSDLLKATLKKGPETSKTQSPKGAVQTQ